MQRICIVFLFIASLSYAEEKRFNVPIEGSPALGPIDAPITIIEFLDYQ